MLGLSLCVSDLVSTVVRDLAAIRKLSEFLLWSEGDWTHQATLRYVLGLAALISDAREASDGRTASHPRYLAFEWSFLFARELVVGSTHYGL